MRALLIILLIIALLLLAACLMLRHHMETGSAISGGAARPPAPSPHVVVDGLNVTHWLVGDLSRGHTCVVDMIDRTAPVLRERYPGRVMYVLKDRTSVRYEEDAHAAFQAAAVRNSVYVCVAERYEVPPRPAPNQLGRPPAHGNLGRDDYYMAMLAERWRCSVITNDKLRDFASLRHDVPPFHVVEYAYWRKRPEREYVRPGAERRPLRMPRVVPPATVLAEARSNLK